MDNSLFEVVNGVRVEKPLSGPWAHLLAFRLASRVSNFAEPHQWGRSTTEQLFRLRAQPDLQRRPMAAYVSLRRWPGNKPLPLTECWDVVPEIAIEVVCPTTLAEWLLDRVMDFLHAGVQLVWVVYPRQQQVYVYESPDRVRLVLANGELDGGCVLPGFRLPLATLFGALTPAA